MTSERTGKNVLIFERLNPAVIRDTIQQSESHRHREDPTDEHDEL